MPPLPPSPAHLPDIEIDQKPAALSRVAVETKPHPKYRRVRLEFVSPVEEKLMGSLTYSLPVLTESSSDQPKVNQAVLEDTPAIQNDPPIIAQPRVGDLELEFRDPRDPFASRFDDRDTTDQLGPELLRLGKLMEDKVSASGLQRIDVQHKLQAQLLAQQSNASLAAEEKHILSRLKEIADAKRASKSLLAAQASRETKSCRSSKRSRSTSQTREPERSSSRPRRKSKSSRKVIIISDDEDDDDTRDADFVDIPKQIHTNDADEASAVEFVPAVLKEDEVIEVIPTPKAGEDDFLEIPHKHESTPDQPVPENFSAATTPSGDVGDPSDAVRSPVGIFPGEAENSPDEAVVPSPLSQLKISSPRKSDMSPSNAVVTRLNADSGSLSHDT